MTRDRLRPAAIAALLVLLVTLVGYEVHINNDTATLARQNHTVLDENHALSAQVKAIVDANNALLDEVHADEMTEKARHDQSVKDTHSIMAKLGIPIPVTTEPQAP